MKRPDVLVRPAQLRALGEALAFSQFGAANGRKVFYFHGAPGATEECVFFDQYGKQNGLTFLCLDRFSIDAAIQGEAYFSLLAKEITSLAGGEKVDIIGFSIGAFVALQTCRQMVDAVESLHLISAAAPLDGGDFLADMAGKTVFQLARKFPIGFALLSYWQGTLALVFPQALFRMLFSSARGEDRALAADHEFRSRITGVLRACFVGRIRGYIRDLDAYVQPWSSSLAGMTVPTHIWHGREDNWSPQSMAEYLASTLANCRHVEMMETASHYSCLLHAAPKIVHALADKRSA